MDVQTLGRIKVTDLNALLTCVLCSGYYIDATTISECLHSFCRTCIVRYLQTNKFCPICEVQVHKTKPLMSIRSDQTLQDIVYKVVPGLFKNEMKRRRDFYSQNNSLGGSAVPVSSEKRGDVMGCERLIFTPEDMISISLEYYPPNLTFPMILHSEKGERLENTLPDVIPKNKAHRRYFQCLGAVTVYHLKKLLRKKYALMSNEAVDIMYMHDQLRDEYTLIDLAYIYSWRRNGPLRLFYKFPNKTNKADDTELGYPSLVSPIRESLSASLPNHCSFSTSSSGPSAAAAPSSQVHLHHPSPPPSPQMAAEPGSTKLANPKCAAMQNRLPNSFVVHDTPKTCTSDIRTSHTREKTAFGSRRKTATMPYGTTLKSSATKLNVLNPYSREAFLSISKPAKNGFKKGLNNSFESNGFSVGESHLPDFQRNSTNLHPSVPNKPMNKADTARLLRKNSL